MAAFLRTVAASALIAAVVWSGAGCGGGDDRTSSSSTPPEPGAGSDRDAGRVEKAIWGPVEMPDGGSAFPVYERLGVDVFQIQLRWADIAGQRPVDPTDPGDPSYDWPADVDIAVREAARHGIALAILVTTSPGWANGGRAEVRAPDDVGDFAAFLEAAARRYPQVHRWLIWGEPNRGDRFRPNRPGDPRGSRRYAQLLDAAFGALHRASPDNVVIGGNVFTGGDVRPPDFIRWMRLPDGRPPRLDWFGANPYPFRLPDLTRPPLPGGWRDLSDLDTLGAEVHRAYRPLGIEPPLWLSEFTVQSERDSRYFAHHVTLAGQARWLRAGYAAAAQAGDVAGLGWFTLLDQPRAPGSADWGLLTSDGKPKPASRAYASLHRLESRRGAAVP
jgi:hypothetical protein